MAEDSTGRPARQPRVTGTRLFRAGRRLVRSGYATGRRTQSQWFGTRSVSMVSVPAPSKTPAHSVHDVALMAPMAV